MKQELDDETMFGTGEEEKKVELTVMKIIDLLISSHGGPSQYIQHILTSVEVENRFVEWLKNELGQMVEVEYIDTKKLAPQEGYASVWHFGFDANSSTKPPPFAITCRQLAAEIDKDGFVTKDEPMRAFIQPSVTKENFVLGHVKGAARFAVLLAPMVWLWSQGKNQKIIDVFPVLFNSARCIKVCVEESTNVLTVALRNATLSQRGSIRKAHDAITWVGKLTALKQSGQDPSNVLKSYNAMASQTGQILGGKRVSVLALMAVGKDALTVILDCVSQLGSDSSPWTDDAWSNKKVMPGYTPRFNGSFNEAWSKRLIVSDESFLLMVQMQSNMQRVKLPQTRRKLDKSAMEEASQLSALVLSLGREMCSNFPIEWAKIDELLLEPFRKGADSNSSRFAYPSPPDQPIPKQHILRCILMAVVFG